MSQSELIRRNVSIEPRDHDVVSRHASQWGQSFSGALRFIIREWASLKHARNNGTKREDRTHEPPD